MFKERYTVTAKKANCTYVFERTIPTPCVARMDTVQCNIRLQVHGIQHERLLTTQLTNLRNGVKRTCTKINTFGKTVRTTLLELGNSAYTELISVVACPNFLNLVSRPPAFRPQGNALQSPTEQKGTRLVPKPVMWIGASSTIFRPLVQPWESQGFSSRCCLALEPLH
jgi:hypothetical protein